MSLKTERREESRTTAAQLDAIALREVDGVRLVDLIGITEAYRVALEKTA